VRGVAVGELPFFAAELCRRQIAIHELIARAAEEGDRRLFLEALCLDPFVRGLSTARNLMEDYLREYRDYLPRFHRAQASASGRGATKARAGGA
jgi:alpha-galactosidase